MLASSTSRLFEALIVEDVHVLYSCTPNERGLPAWTGKRFATVREAEGDQVGVSRYPVVNVVEDGDAPTVHQSAHASSGPS